MLHDSVLCKFTIDIVIKAAEEPIRKKLINSLLLDMSGCLIYIIAIYVHAVYVNASAAGSLLRVISI